MCCKTLNIRLNVLNLSIKKNVKLIEWQSQGIIHGRILPHTTHGFSQVKIWPCVTWQKSCIRNMQRKKSNVDNDEKQKILFAFIHFHQRKQIHVYTGASISYFVGKNSQLMTVLSNSTLISTLMYKSIIKINYFTRFFFL